MYCQKITNVSTFISSTLAIVLSCQILAKQLTNTTSIAKSAIPRLQHAKLYRQDIKLEQYWVSEKLDGVRGYWHGKKLLTRQGNQLHPPVWFTLNWPNKPMDGELWSKRNEFENISACVRKKSADDCWKNIKYMIFDLPNENKPFSQRIQLMKKLVNKTNSSFLAMIKQEKITTQKALYKKLDAVVAQQGEGLMLHKGSAYYQQGRTDNILKLKKYYDGKAIILKHIAGKGKYQNMLGAIEVKTLDKQEIVFRIGSGFSDKERKNPPPIGSIITYKYIGKTQRGVPKFASFLRTELKRTSQ